LDDAAAAMPANGPSVVSHGDLHLDQALVEQDRTVLIDFDHICLASRAYDPATLAAHLVTGRPGDLGTALAVLDKLVAGYGSRPSALGWYLGVAILRRSSSPFRFLDPDWPARVIEMVRAAGEALAGP